MLHRASILLLVTLSVMPLAAQAPEGLRVRVDRSTDAGDPDNTPELKVVAAGSGYRVTGGPAGTFWNPAQTASGTYTLRGSFTLMQPSGHVNYYGLVFGGSDLAGASQAYTYFVVAQNGTFQVRQRAGEMVTTVVGRTEHAAIRRPGPDGTSVNALEVRVAADTVSFVVNGTVVQTVPRMQVRTDGLVGTRINHVLDVRVDSMAVVR